MEVQINAEDISISQRLPISSKYKGKRRLSTITVTFERRSTTEKLIIVGQRNRMPSPLKILGLENRITSS